MTGQKSRGYDQPNNGLITASALVLGMIVGGTALSVLAARLAGV